MKKAQASTQFNWIFVLIVGGFFLLMFFVMSTRQGETAETRISAAALQGLTTIFESARTGTSLSTKIDVPNVKIEFTCERGLFNSDSIYSDYRLGGHTRKIPALPTFVPGTLEGEDMVTWTVSWEMPFKIMNFLFLANSKTRFFFYLPDSENSGNLRNLKKAINESFSNNVNHLFVSDENLLLDYNDDYSIIAIIAEDDTFVDEMTFDFSENFENDVKIVQIVPSSENILFGNIDYFDKNKNYEDSTVYFGLASLYGAIFSPDKDYYECSMYKAVKRFNRVACVYKQKYDSMRIAYQDNVNCNSAYTSAVGTIGSYFGNDFCSTQDGGRLELGSFELDLENYDSEYSFYTSLARENRNTIIRSCELLY